MKALPITNEDIELIKAAEDTITKHFKVGKHHVGAAIRTKSGKIITSINFEAYIRRADICAEAIAIGRAILQGESSFDTIVAVRHPYSYENDQAIKVISPCGVCRELIYDYGPDIKVIIPNNKGVEKYSISDLLPFKYEHE
jgi:cytidine deaminase